MAGEVTILGIDPGSQVTGYGVIRVSGPRLVYVASGCIRTRAGSELAERLRAIHDGMVRLVAEHDPGEVCIERVFMHRNADSALKLGQARAAAICGTFGLEVPIHEYAPRQVKQTVTGSGSAEKSQVSHMVKRLLGVRGVLASDAADALAVAICHAHMRRGRSLGLAAGSRFA